MESKKSVLVVDDDISITSILENYLLFKDVDVITVNSAFEAIEKVKSQVFDLILTDVNMPNINGFELLLWLKKNQVKSHVVIMTAQSNEKAKEVYHNYGIVKYLSKPLELSKLLELIQQIDKSGFESNISEITLFDYIQIMSLTKKTTALSVEEPFSDIQAYLYFKNGEIVEAEYRDIKGEEAFYKIIKMNGGTINEVEKDLPENLSITIPSMSLLFKATQIIDEENHKNKKVENKYSILFLHSNQERISQFINKFSDNEKIDFKIANSDDQAIAELHNRYFDLIVGDISLLRDNGAEILIWLRMNKINPKIIVLVDKDDENIETYHVNDLNIIYMYKPLDMQKLEDFINTDLKTEFDGNIHEITLFDYIQMISLSKKSKTVEIISPIAYSNGKLYFKKGNLINAEYESLKGIEAVFKIMSMPGGIISEINNSENIEQTISLSLPSLLMKATMFLEQENMKKTNINIDDKVIDSINKKIANIINSINTTNTFMINKEINNLSNQVRPEPMINKSIFAQRKDINDGNINNKAKEGTLGIFSIKRKVKATEEENPYLKTFNSLKYIIPTLSEKGEAAIKNPSTDMSLYQMLKKIDGKLSLEQIYQNSYYHLDLIDFYNKFEPAINLINFKEVDKDNIKPTIFQILISTNTITTDKLSQIINSYLEDNNHSNNDRNFLDGSFLVESGAITNPELTKTVLFINKFNKFADNFL